MLGDIVEVFICIALFYWLSHSNSMMGLIKLINAWTLCQSDPCTGIIYGKLYGHLLVGKVDALFPSVQILVLNIAINSCYLFAICYLLFICYLFAPHSQIKCFDNPDHIFAFFSPSSMSVLSLHTSSWGPSLWVTLSHRNVSSILGQLGKESNRRQVWPVQIELM